MPIIQVGRRDSACSPAGDTIWVGITVVDETQAIKNSGAKQTLAVKKLIANTRIALTGTRAEKGLPGLWSNPLNNNDFYWW
jgi:hypothetical protein